MQEYETLHNWRHVIAEWLFRLAFWVLDCKGTPTVRINGRRYFGPDIGWCQEE